MGFFSFLFGTKKHLSQEESKRFCNRIQRTSKLDPSHSLMESHKILVSTIKQMEEAQERSAAKLLTKVVDRLPNEEEIWTYHKMRNKAAHAVGYEVKPIDAKKARSAFKKAIKALAK